MNSIRSGNGLDDFEHKWIINQSFLYEGGFVICQ